MLVPPWEKECNDKHPKCSVEWINNCYDSQYGKWMEENCPKTCGKCYSKSKLLGLMGFFWRFFVILVVDEIVIFKTKWRLTVSRFNNPDSKL